MNRRRFFSRISRAALAFSVAPGVFKAFPAAKNVEAAVVTQPKVVSFWFQTMRGSRCIDPAYAEFIKTQIARSQTAMPNPDYVSAPEEGIFACFEKDVAQFQQQFVIRKYVLK